MSWIRITNTENIPLREGRSVLVNGRDIAIFNLGDRFLAVENRCPHGGGPLAEGIVSGNTVVCPLHAWKVCLESGAVKKPQSDACLMTYPVETVGDIVCVDVPASARAA